MDNLDSIIFHRVLIPGLPGDGMTVAEASALRADLADYEAQLAAFGLDDLADVNVSGVTSGQYLRWTGAAWTPATVATGLTEVVKAGDAGTSQLNVNRLVLQGPLTTSSAGTGSAYISVNYGASGTSSNVARADHAHNVYTPTRGVFTPGGYMSSGTRNLTSVNVTLPAGITCTVKARLNMQMRGADPGACYYRLAIAIDGNTRTSNSGSNGFWCVQGVPDKTTWEHHFPFIGTGAAITVSASVQYDSGGGFYTDAGELVVEVEAAR